MNFSIHTSFIICCSDSTKSVRFKKLMKESIFSDCCWKFCNVLHCTDSKEIYYSLSIRGWGKTPEKKAFSLKVLSYLRLHTFWSWVPVVLGCHDTKVTRATLLAETDFLNTSPLLSRGDCSRLPSCVIALDAFPKVQSTCSSLWKIMQ